MICPLCQRRKARRRCPALDQTICSTCCGTKRMSEIACPADCGYLASARQHPPAVIQRRQARDLRFLWPFVEGLGEPQAQLFIALHSVVKRHKASAVPALGDSDVAEAAASVAATFETADRGIIYEHQATSLQAQGLARALRSALDSILKAAGPSGSRQAAVVLRRLERAACAAGHDLAEGPRSYLQMIDRFPSDPSAGPGVSAPDGAETAAAPGLILP